MLGFHGQRRVKHVFVSHVKIQMEEIETKNGERKQNHLWKKFFL